MKIVIHLKWGILAFSLTFQSSGFYLVCPKDSGSKLSIRRFWIQFGWSNSYQKNDKTILPIVKLFQMVNRTICRFCRLINVFLSVGGQDYPKRWISNDHKEIFKIENPFRCLYVVTSNNSLHCNVMLPVRFQRPVDNPPLLLSRYFIRFFTMDSLGVFKSMTLHWRKGCPFFDANSYSPYAAWESSKSAC